MSQLPIGKATPRGHWRFVEKYAPHWESICAHMNVEPSQIKASVAERTAQAYAYAFIIKVCNAARTVGELLQALQSAGYATTLPELCDTLDIPVVRERVPTRGETHVKVYNELTPGDKATLLLRAGVSAGQAASFAVSGPAEFLGVLERNGKMEDAQFWHDYPSVLTLLGLKAPASATVASSSHAATMQIDHDYRERNRDTTQPVVGHNASHVPWKSKMAAAIDVSVKVDTLRKLVHTPGNRSVAQLVDAMGQRDGWLRVMQTPSIIPPSDDVVAFCAQISESAQKDEENFNAPFEMLVELCDSELFRDMPFDTFLAKLLAVEHSETRAAAQKLIAERAARTQVKHQSVLTATSNTFDLFSVLQNNSVKLRTGHTLRNVVDALRDKGVLTLEDMAYVTPEMLVQSGVTEIGAAKLKQTIIPALIAAPTAPPQPLPVPAQPPVQGK